MNIATRGNLALMSTREAAHVLRVSVSTFHRLVERGEVTPLFRGPGSRGALFFDRAEIVAMAEAELEARRQALTEAGA